LAMMSFSAAVFGSLRSGAANAGPPAARIIAVMTAVVAQRRMLRRFMVSTSRPGWGDRKDWGAPPGTGAGPRERAPFGLGSGCGHDSDGRRGPDPRGAETGRRSGRSLA